MKISQVIAAFLVTSAAAGTLRAARTADGVLVQQGLHERKSPDGLVGEPQAATIPGLPEDIQAIPEKVAKWRKESSIPHMLQLLFAFLWIFILGSAPFIFPIIDSRAVTKTQVALAALTMVVLVGGFYLFTNVILFESSHWEGSRPLTVVECIYFMAQVITTVGYGDIGPAKTRGQIFVGLYVMFSLFVIAMVLEDFTEHVVRMAAQQKKKWRSDGTEEVLLSARERRDIDISSLLVPQKPALKGLYTALAVFAFFDITFIMFFSMCPGEEKSLFEATYMSLITLGTVGFGFFTPATADGMLFAAFWMVAGCSSLVGVIGEFTQLMYQLNEYERFNKAEGKMDAMESLKNITHGKGVVTSVDFLQFVLIQSKKVDKDEIDNILKVFESLDPKNGAVDMMAVQHAATPRNMIVT